MSPTDRHSQVEQRKASPLAVLGALGLVAVAVAFGVLGPQINDRGNVIVGAMLDGLLQDVTLLYERDQFKALFDPEGGERPTVAMIEKELFRRYGDRAVYVDFAFEGFEPVSLDSRVQLEGFDAEAVGVTYEDVSTSSDGSSVAVLLYIEDPHPRITRDEFGVPLSMVQGQVYVRATMSGRGTVIWSASWYDGSVTHVLVTGANETLIGLIKSMGVSDVQDANSRLIATFEQTPRFDTGRCRGTLG